MTKQLIMTEEEYNEAIRQAKGEGSSLMAKIVKDIFTTGGANLDIREDANPDVVRFINELKDIKKRLDDATTNRKVTEIG